MSADKLTDCPLDECPGSVKRLLGTGAGIVFKGSGFYETDFKDKKQPTKKDDNQSTSKGASPPASSNASPKTKDS